MAARPWRFKSSPAHLAKTNCFVLTCKQIQMFQKKTPQFTDEIGVPKRKSFLVSVFGEQGGSVVSWIIEVVQIGVLALALVVLIRTFLIQPFSVKGASMEPSYFNNEYLIIDEVTYRFREPIRGEAVVFRYPVNPKEYFIKRIIGLPGEHVVIQGGAVRIINEEFPLGRPLSESYTDGLETLGEYDFVLGDNEYFLMGDNRDASLDSRMFGPVTADHIIGRVWLRGWPPHRIGVMAVPGYNL